MSELYTYVRIVGSEKKAWVTAEKALIALIGLSFRQYSKNPSFTQSHGKALHL